MTILIPHEFEGRLLRSYLTHTLSLSTATISRLKNHERGIVVNGERVTVRYVLHTGDVLELADRDTPDTATRTVLPADLPLDILYEDDRLIALNKPAGMPTHPSHGHLTDTLANALAWRYATRGEPFVFRPLGRLDRNTSGVVIAAKTRAVSGFLGRALQEGRVIKRYLAVLEGELALPAGGTGYIDAPIHRVAASGIRRNVCSADAEGAERALTAYRVLAVAEGHTLVLAEPKTGRTHQLRVHFTHVGHPLVGDDLYGSPDPRMARHALHALSLSVPLPFVRAIEGGDIPMPSLEAHTPLNIPSPDGYLHTLASLPSDMKGLLRRYFPGMAEAISGMDTAARLIRL